MRIEEQRALCTSRKTLCGIMLYAVIQRSTLTMDLARPGPHAAVERSCAQSARSLGRVLSALQVHPLFVAQSSKQLLMPSSANRKTSSRLLAHLLIFQ